MASDEVLSMEEHESTSPSNTIDHMLSMFLFDYSDIELGAKGHRGKERCHTIGKLLPPIKRQHPIALRSPFSKVDSLRRLAWNKTGPKQIEKAERQIFDTLKCHVDGAFVPISNKNQRIWTITTNLKSKNIPLVLLHGFGGGVGLWSLNLDELCAGRPVYAIDLPGFARSSRPVFSLDPIKAEEQFVKMIDAWRAAIGLNEPFILLGHSFGGFVSAAYALRHPEYVKQLVLIDPWGFSRRPKNIWQTGRLQRIPTWLRSFSGIILKLSPLAGLRAAGPLGVPVIKYFRADLRIKFEKLFSDDRILIYLYHCNAQLPTGEQAFRTISDCFAWAKEPMVERIHLLDEQIPIHFLHGGQSWITAEASALLKEKRANVFAETIPDAGHHIYADAPEEFEEYLKRTLLNRE